MRADRRGCPPACWGSCRPGCLLRSGLRGTADWASSASSVPWSSSAPAANRSPPVRPRRRGCRRRTRAEVPSASRHRPGLAPRRPPPPAGSPTPTHPSRHRPHSCRRAEAAERIAAVRHAASSVSAESGVPTSAPCWHAAWKTPGPAAAGPPTPRLATVTTAMAMPRPARNRVRRESARVLRALPLPRPPRRPALREERRSQGRDQRIRVVIVAGHDADIVRTGDSVTTDRSASRLRPRCTSTRMVPSRRPRIAATSVTLRSATTRSSTASA